MLDVPSLLIGGAVGAAITWLTRFGNNRIDAVDRNRERKAEFKRSMADQLTAFCVEAEDKNFNLPPNSQPHIRRIADDIDSIDQEVGEKLRTFLGFWVKASKIGGKSRYRYHAKKVCKELREVAKEWKK